MREEIEQLVNKEISKIGLTVSNVFMEKEDNLKSLCVELDSEQTITSDLITEATKIINPILDKTDYVKDVDYVDIFSKVKGSVESAR